MQLVQYTLHCADPVLKLLRQNPGTLVGRRYAGYLVFLFGAADEDFATWFARNLVALDSLTGTEICGVVFAARIRLRSETKHPTNLRGHNRPFIEKLRQELASKSLDLERDREVYLNQICLVDPEYRSRWHGDESEITAVTYGTDEIARRLGVLHDLPCLIVIDSVPSPDIEVMRLNKYSTNELIPVLRDVIQKFRSLQAFKPYFECLSRAQELDDKIAAIAQSICRTEDKLKSAKQRVSYELLTFRETAHKALADASIR